MQRLETTVDVVQRDKAKRGQRGGGYYIPPVKSNELSRKFGTNGWLLFNNYYDHCYLPKFDITDDKKNGKYMKWPWRKVQKERLKLIKGGWLFVFTCASQLSGWCNARLVLIGPDSVEKFKLDRLKKEAKHETKRI